ncbi:MAG TPA: DUF3040 domain-containing protein [Acidimicrobiales bacterium]|nr:DUF3040 domain-containing protein [Acidimicrobiales bacterium]
MPLSEDEQRILQEIERNFYDSDPAFAREVSTAALTRNASRNLRWAAVGFVAGLVLLITLFAESVLLGFVGFAVMVVSGFAFYVNVAKLGRASLSSVTARTGSITEMFGERRQKLRERFKKDE